MPVSKYLSNPTPESSSDLEKRLLARQSGHCFISDQPIDVVLRRDQLYSDPIGPLVEQGLDAENNFALRHASRTRSKSALNQEVTSRLANCQRLQSKTQDRGDGSTTILESIPPPCAIPIVDMAGNLTAPMGQGFGSIVFSERAFSKDHRGGANGLL